MTSDQEQLIRDTIDGRGVMCDQTFLQAVAAMLDEKDRIESLLADYGEVIGHNGRGFGVDEWTKRSMALNREAMHLDVVRRAKESEVVK